MKILNRLNDVNYEYYFLVALCGYILSSIGGIIVTGISYLNPQFVSDLNIFLWLLIFISAILICELLRVYLKSTHFIYYSFQILIFVYALVLILQNMGNVFFTFGVCVIFIVINIYLYKYDKIKVIRISLSDKVSWTIVTLLFLTYVAVVGGTTVLRYINYKATALDFSIFSQMFYYMSRDFSQNTTIEANRLLSHFEVHFSPIYYLILPIFILFKSPMTLLIIQSALIASSVFVIYKLCKLKNVSNSAAVCICAAFILFPALIGANFYDFHENAFLTPLLLWLLYFVEKNDNKGILITGVITLLVKEDAPVYVACVALYMIINKKYFKSGFTMLAISVTYFIVIMFILIGFNGGQGIAVRFSGIYDGGEAGILPLLKAIIFNFGYVLNSMFSVEKFIFLAQMFMPLLFIPLINSKLSAFILLIPMLLFNLFTDYGPQFTIYFQYTLGIVSIIFYLLVINYSRITKKIGGLLLINVLAISLIFTVSFLGFKFSDNIRFYNSNREYIEIVDEILAEIPEQASVSASANLTTKLTHLRTLYMFPVTVDTEYLVFDLRPSRETQIGISAEDYNSLIKYTLSDTEYGAVHYIKDWLLVMKREHSNEKNGSVLLNQFSE